MNIIFFSFSNITRYQLSGHVLPLLRDWMMDAVGISLDHKSPPQVFG